MAPMLHLRRNLARERSWSPRIQAGGRARSARSSTGLRSRHGRGGLAGLQWYAAVGLVGQLAIHDPGRPGVGMRVAVALVDDVDDLDAAHAEKIGEHRAV